VDGSGRRPLVLISGKDLLGGFGGHESYVRAHALAAASAGFAPHVFCVGTRVAEAVTDFGTVHTVATPAGWRPPVAFHGALLARSVVRFLASYPGPHLIHSFAIWSGAGVAASRSLAHRGITAIPVASAYGTRSYEVSAMQDALAPHHGLAHRLGYRAWLRWVRLVDDRVEGRGYKQSRLVLVNYESVRRILVDAYGNGLDVRRLPYASPAAFSDLPRPCSVPEPVARLGSPTAPLVVAVSRHDPRKSIDLLLLALADVAATGIAFRGCIIGPGRLLDAHRRLATELGLADLVAIPGRVDDVWPYLHHADVFVLPSVAEASGSVSVLEALQTGTAVIASDCDGIPEDLDNGVDALLFPAGDWRALAGALRTVLTDPARRAELAAGSRRIYEDKFSAPGFVRALAHTYAELGIGP
jgi:glycosyltransferase involved in cell wall biosynthesis